MVYMVVSGEEKTMKPDPQLYRILQERYGIEAGESLFIDDNYANIETAQQLGFQTIHMIDGMDLEELLKAKAVL